MLKLVILVVCIGFIAVDAQVTPTPTRTPIPCYYQSGVCGFSNFTMENTEVLFESTKSTSSDYCTPISDCIAFGGCLSFNMLLTIDNEGDCCETETVPNETTNTPKPVCNEPIIHICGK